MKKHIISIIAVTLVLAAVAGALVLADKLFYKPDTENSSSSESYRFESTDYNIVIDIPIGYITVFKTSDSVLTVDTVGISGEFYKTESDPLSVTVSGSKLRWYDKLRYSTADIYGITIAIPEDFSGTLNLSTEIGNVKLYGISADNISIKTETGDVSLDSVSFLNSAEISVNTGDIETVNSSASDPDSDASLIMKTNIGNINAKMPLNRESYSLSASASVGSVPESFDSGKIRLEISADIGEITVSFDK